MGRLPRSVRPVFVRGQFRGAGVLGHGISSAGFGVTPSTIYRRWGDLQELLSDVAVERLRPESPPADLGSLREDLEHWAADFLEEMSSPPGRSYIRDALSGDPDGGNAGRCSAYAVEQVDTVLARARARGEHVPDTEIVMDHVVAPMMYRILFRPGLLDAQYARDLVTTVFYRLMPPPLRGRRGTRARRGPGRDAGRGCS